MSNQPVLDKKSLARSLIGNAAYGLLTATGIAFLPVWKTWGIQVRGWIWFALGSIVSSVIAYALGRVKADERKREAETAANERKRETDEAHKGREKQEAAIARLAADIETRDVQLAAQRDQLCARSEYDWLVEFAHRQEADISPYIRPDSPARYEINSEPLPELVLYLRFVNLSLFDVYVEVESTVIEYEGIKLTHPVRAVPSHEFRRDHSLMFAIVQRLTLEELTLLRNPPAGKLYLGNLRLMASGGERFLRVKRRGLYTAMEVTIQPAPASPLRGLL